jgi:hypothetical protein
MSKWFNPKMFVVFFCLCTNFSNESYIFFIATLVDDESVFVPVLTIDSFSNGSVSTVIAVDDRIDDIYDTNAL